MAISVLLHFLKWWLGFARPETQTTEAERNCLANYAAGKRCLAEIGVWHGVTTCRLREAMAPDGVLYAIDPYPAGRLGVSFQRQIAHAEVGRLDRGRVEWVRKSGAHAAQDLARHVSGRVELLFIDGDHTYEGLKADWEAWSGLIAAKGIVALHDSRSTPTRAIADSGSARFTCDVILNDARYRVVELVDSLTVLERHEFR